MRAGARRLIVTAGVADGTAQLLSRPVADSGERHATWRVILANGWTRPLARRPGPGD